MRTFHFRVASEAGQRSFRRTRSAQTTKVEIKPIQKLRVVADPCPERAVAGHGVGGVERETDLNRGPRVVELVQLYESRRLE